MSTDTKSPWTAVGVGVFLLLLLAIGYFAFKQVQPEEGEQAADSETDTGSLGDRTSPSASSRTTTAPPTVLTEAERSERYTKALKTYQYKIQVADCKGVVIPGEGTLLIKQGNNFMLDNRDPIAHTFVIKNQTFRVNGYDFAIVTARDTGNYFITCDGASSAMLDVQP